MKKFITLFSLIALFFIGMQHTQAQEKKSLDENQGKEKVAQYNEIANKEKQQSPEHQAKVAKLATAEASDETHEQLGRIQEFVTDLSGDQQRELHKALTVLNKNLSALDSNGKSKKVTEARSALNEEADLRIKKILNDEQYVFYQQYVEKSAKSEK